MQLVNSWFKRKMPDRAAHSCKEILQYSTYDPLNLPTESSPCGNTVVNKNASITLHLKCWAAGRYLSYLH